MVKLVRGRFEVSRKIVCLSSDLMTLSQLQGAAAACDTPFTSANSWSQAGKHTAEGLALILVDLALAGVHTDMAEQIADLKQKGAKLVAFGPHVHEQKLAQAKAAGCDEVLSRGQLLSGVAMLESLLQD